MKIGDLAEEIYWGLSANKVRSFLTILGIVIGIGSVIALQAIGTGAQGTITSRIESAGSNLLYVTPGAQRGVGMSVSSGRGSATTLTRADAEAIAGGVNGVKAVEPELSRRYQVAAEGQNTNVSIIGTVSNYPDVHNVQVESGSFFTDDQIQSIQRVAVIGPTVRDDLFGSDADPIGQSIRINKVDFKVIGMTVAKGGSGFNNPDDQIYVPITTAQQFLAGSNDIVSNITIAANSAGVMSQVQSDVTSLLLDRHHISDSTQADFSVLSQSDILAAASSVTGTFTTLLASIAGISLLVGGIGIMNMMLTTVTERTKEIGLRQAIGAEKSDISRQFLFEAVSLTFVGGGFGIVLGWAASFILSKFTGINGQISMSSVILAFSVSAGIGIVFGYYPARRAASLNPIDALRFE